MEKSAWERLIDSLLREGLLRSEKITNALRAVPREKFLPENMKDYAAVDTPLPIGFGQTASAPHMVAIMNEALELSVGNKVLEVGAGSGWHSATIAEVIAPHDAPRSEWGHVYTVEIIQELADFARKNVMNMGYGDRVSIVIGDGSQGFAEFAPYDRVLVTSAAPAVPKPLADELKNSGVMLVPVGNAALFQTLLKIKKDADGKTSEENLGGVAFVPLTGKFGHKV